MKLNRRQWLGRMAAGGAGVLMPFRRAAADSPVASPVQAKGAAAAAKAPGCPLALEDFQPRSMLHVPEHKVARAAFPVIDVHTHLSWSGGLKGTDKSHVPGHARGAARGHGPQERADHVQPHRAARGRGSPRPSRASIAPCPAGFLSYTEPSWARLNEPGFPQKQADAIESAKNAGARGLKVLKTLGLFLRENITSGPLVKVDDPRFDPMWDACGRLGIPVSIHVSDPEAFFLPIDRFNERYDELGHHPDWSFHGRDFPSNAEILAARDRMLARHPGTQFILHHVGHDAENLGFVSETLDRFPNTTVEIGARIGELGRQPRASRKFFEKYQDRILFGTDAVPPPDGDSVPQQVFKDELYEIYFRFLETEDEYFDYAPAAIPPQGRWRIYGIGLPEPILKKVYHDNAARILGLA